MVAIFDFKVIGPRLLTLLCSHKHVLFPGNHKQACMRMMFFLSVTGTGDSKFSREKRPSVHACTSQGSIIMCLTPKKGQDWLPHFELFWTFSFHGETFEVCFPYFNLMWLCSSCRMRSSLPRLECLPSHWGNSILCPMPPLIRSDGITQDIMA